MPFWTINLVANSVSVFAKHTNKTKQLHCFSVVTYLHAFSYETVTTIVDYTPMDKLDKKTAVRAPSHCDLEWRAPEASVLNCNWCDKSYRCSDHDPVNNIVRIHTFLLQSFAPSDVKGTVGAGQNDLHIFCTPMYSCSCALLGAPRAARWCRSSDRILGILGDWGSAAVDGNKEIVALRIYKVIENKNMLLKYSKTCIRWKPTKFFVLD